MTTKAEYVAAKKEFLKKHIKPGDRLFFVERYKTPHSRWMDVYGFYQDPNVDGGAIRSWRLTSLVALVGGLEYDEKSETIKVTNFGINSDMYITHQLSRVLFGEPHFLKYETLR